MPPRTHPRPCIHRIGASASTRTCSRVPTTAWEAGLSVIVDAAFLKEPQRRMFRELAQRRAIRFTLVSCRAGRQDMAQRIAARAARGTDPSDADLAVLDAQLSRAQPLTSEERPYEVAVDTTRPDADQAAFEALKERRQT